MTQGLIEESPSTDGSTKVNIQIDAIYYYSKINAWLYNTKNSQTKGRQHSLLKGINIQM
jgi:hypothetical protein